MICEQVAEFPQASVALYIRVSVNLFAQMVPDILSLTKVTVTEPQLSFAITVFTLIAGTCPIQDTVTAGGHIIVGTV
jgi:hypothetical protein